MPFHFGLGSRGRTRRVVDVKYDQLATKTCVFVIDSKLATSRRVVDARRSGGRQVSCIKRIKWSKYSAPVSE